MEDGILSERLLYSPLEIVRLTGLSRAKVYSLLRGGDLPSIRIGSSIRVRRADFEAWVASRPSVATSPRRHEAPPEEGETLEERVARAERLSVESRTHR